MYKSTSRILTALLSAGIVLIGAGQLIGLAAGGTVTLNPVSGTPGTQITVSGSTGFSANETVTITFDSTQLATNFFTNNTTGAWSGTITIPESYGGSHGIWATGNASGISANATFTVTPSLGINTSAGPVGTPVTVSGIGFKDGESGIVLTYDGSTVVSGITASNKGSWNRTFNILASASGSRTIDASSGSTAASAVADTSFAVTPSISSNLANAAPGASVIITGTGFGASEQGITVTYDGVAAAPTTTANSKGGWTVTFVVPASPAGTHTIDAKGSITSESNVSDITFTTSAGLKLSRASAPPGTTVTVTGTGFAASETSISVTYDGNPVASTTANAQGGWTATFTVPPSPAGSHTIDASGAATAAATIPDVTFSVISGISANRLAAPPGSSITVTGTGFVVSESGITVIYDDKTVAAGITANTQGGWSATFVVPQSPSGSHIIDASGSVSTAASTPDLSFTVVAGISTNKPSAAPGSSVTVTGSGFGAGETGISVTYDDKTVAQGITATPQGGWSTNFIIPASTSGTHSIKAQGSVTQLVSLGDTGGGFNIGAGVLLDPPTGNVGGKVNLSGSGFAPTSPIKIAYDNAVIANATTDETGSFTSSVTIPASVKGSHAIKVTDGANGTSSATFTMEDVPPPVPALISPKDGTRVGLTGDISPALKWSAVNDPSGVTYAVQIDTDPDFTHPLVDKKPIQGSRYTLTSSEALPRGQYYWRVKAIDGASNESAWGDTWQLKAGLMSLGALIGIILFALAIIAGLAYFFLVARRPKRLEGIPVPEAAEGPRPVAAQWRLVEPGEGAGGERPLPYRLALPQAEKSEKSLSTEEMARLKVIVDFAQSLPLAEPGYNAKWLLDLAQSSMGIDPTTEVYRQLLGNELQVRYEPAWMRHPIFQDLAALLEGQPILEDLNAFVDAVNRCAADVTSSLQQIYGEASSELPPDSLNKGGWGFIAAVYTDAVRWYLGRALHDPSERDYVIKPGAEEGAVYLWGNEASGFGESLIRASDDGEAARLRDLHLKLRRAYRNSPTIKQLVDMMTQMAVQRDKLSAAFSQFSNFTK